MAAQPDLNSLLRFLSQDAKLPLSTAIRVAKPLQDASLSSPQQISSANIATLTPLFPSPDDAKRVLSAAKRVSKRVALDGTASSPRKKRKLSPTGEVSPEEEAARFETSLSLPFPVTDSDILASKIIVTNRAPLLLVFTLTLLEYTMPQQPLSSRLSLAQAVVSEGARKQAKYLGIVKDGGAEEDGWGTGQPTVRVMGRDIGVIRRVGYPVAEAAKEKAETTEHVDAMKKEKVIGLEQEQAREHEGTVHDQRGKGHGEPLRETCSAGDQQDRASQEDEEVAFWALDLEALKKSNSNIASNITRTGTSGLPIYSPQSARAYIMKAFASVPLSSTTDAAVEDGKSSKSKKSRNEVAQQEENLGLLLGALKLLFDSWKTLDHIELGRRAWSWYVTVRPDVEQGPGGWGGKGEVGLQKILDLSR